MKKHTFDVHEQMENSLSDYQWESVPELNDHIEPAQNIDNMKVVMFNCAICDKGFQRKKKLQQHIELAHNKIVPLDSL